MNGKVIADYLNQVSGGVDVYGYDEQSDRIIVVEKDNLNHTTIMSTGKAFNELKEKTYNMLMVIGDIFKGLIEDKPAGNNGNT